MYFTTYRRNEKLHRFLLQFDHRFRDFIDFFEIYVADDDPFSSLDIEEITASSPLNIRYHKNHINFGQGINHVQSAKSNLNFKYFWFPGDDDLIVVEQFLQVLSYIKVHQPTIAAFEFRQGSNLSYGTNFSGKPRLEYDLNTIIASLNCFGKCTSAIIKNQGHILLISYCLILNIVCTKTKLWALFSVFSDSHPCIYIHPNLTAYADIDYGQIRYSARVFSNLSLTTRKVLSYFNHLNQTDLTLLPVDSPSPLWWWRWGIAIYIVTRIRYKIHYSKILFELFFGFFVAVYFHLRDDFQPHETLLLCLCHFTI